MTVIWPDILSSARQHRRSVLAELQARGHDPLEALYLLASRLGMPVLEEQMLAEVLPAKAALPMEQLGQWGLLPLTLPDGRTAAVITDPMDEALEERIATLFDEGPQRYLTDTDTFSKLLGRFANSAVSSKDRPESNSAVRDGEGLRISQRVDDILADALRSEASDIHMESTGNGLRIKYRIDGVLVPASLLETQVLADQVISRLKILSELDIAERRIPQDGRFQSRIRERNIDFRVSIMPSMAGEDAVIRILDRQSLTQQSQALTLDAIGFDAGTLQSLRRMIHAPYGMLLVTGPTGSGKTTTLYAALNEVNSGEDKIITIEDPVEYQLPDVLQIPVNERKGLTFARGLRSILRHDPDKIMVGEIRDEETAEIAVQAALTGHLVFTTVHANNVFDVIGRFAHMGVDTYNFVSALTGVMAQRLVRLVCPHCSQEHHPTPDELAAAGLSSQNCSHFSFRQGAGCHHCRQTGYKGRRAIAEVLPLNDELRDLIINRASTSRLRQTARANGMTSLREAVMTLVQQGQTTLQEANRVTFME